MQVKFYQRKNAAVLNLSEKGKGTETERKAGDDDNTAVALVEAKADEKMKANDKLTLSEAYSSVLSENKELAEKYDTEING